MHNKAARLVHSISTILFQTIHQILKSNHHYIIALDQHFSHELPYSGFLHQQGKTVECYIASVNNAHN